MDFKTALQKEVINLKLNQKEKEMFLEFYELNAILEANRTRSEKKKRDKILLKIKKNKSLSEKYYVWHLSRIIKTSSLIAGIPANRIPDIDLAKKFYKNSESVNKIFDELNE